jgi:MFS family permease
MRLLIGTSVLWFGLSMFADGATTLILPDLLEDQLPEGFEVTVLGLVTFVGLAAAALVQPVAGHLSDRLGAGWRRQPVIAAGAGQQDLPAFAPDGCLYVVDWGEIDLAPERGGSA